MKTGFVTDSTADIPAELAEQYAIEIVPALINLHGRSYEDGTGLSREAFYALLPKLNILPTTSAPSVGSFQERYERLLKAGASHVLSIHPPDRLSGIFNAARLAAREFGERVQVLDSGQVSLGLGFQVLIAAESAARGALLDETLELVESLRRRIRLVALLDTIEYVRRSGRVSWAKAMLGNMLHIQPLVELRYGIVERLGQVRTRAQGIHRLIEMQEAWGPLNRLAVLHTNAEAAARQLLEDLQAKVPIPPLLVNVTTVVGVHVGPNALGFCGVPAG